MNSEEKLIEGLKLVVEAFTEMIKVQTQSTDLITDKSNIKTFKLKEAAEYLDITEYRMRLLAKQGKIKCFKAGNRYLFRSNDLDEWLKSETK